MRNFFYNLKALTPEKLHLDPVFLHMNEGVAIHRILYNEGGVAIDYVIEDTNPAYETNTGISPSKALQKTGREVYGTPEAPFLKEFSTVAQDLLPQTLKVFFPPLQRNFEVTVVSAQQGTFITIFRDVSVETSRAKALHKAYNTNYLTNLPNYRLFTNYINKRFVYNNKPFSLIEISLQNLDTITHVYSKAVRDKAIQTIAATIKDFQKNNSPIGITTTNEGPGTFFVIMEGNTSHQVLLLKQSIETPLRIHNKNIKLTAAIGYAESISATSANDLIQRAHLALQHSLNLRKTPAILASDQLIQQSLNEQLLKEAVWHAIHADNPKEIYVVYQPKKTPAGALAGLEALVRWSPNGTTANTQEFVNTVEQLGLAEALFSLVLHRVCKDIQAWLKNNKKLCPISINLSPTQLSRIQTLPIIESNLKHYNISPELLEFEITEGQNIEHFADAKELLQQIHSLGCRTSLDDFGVGYSNLKDLTRLPFDTIKFDRSWLKDIESDNVHLDFIKGLIHIIHTLDISVLFEGVETQNQLATLTAIAVDYIQGYLFSKPLDPKTIEQMLDPLDQ